MANLDEGVPKAGCCASCSNPFQRLDPEQRRILGAAFSLAVILTAIIVPIKNFYSCTEFEQLVALRHGEREVVDGPTSAEWLYGADVYKRTMPVLSATEYLVVTDHLSGDRRIQRGPGVMSLGPYEAAAPCTIDEQSLENCQPEVKSSWVLDENQYLKMEDELTGDEIIVRGPQRYFPETAWQVVDTNDDDEDIHEAIILTNLQYIEVSSERTGTRRYVSGPTLYFPAADEEVSAVMRAVRLLTHQFALITNDATGAQRIEAGPKLVIPALHESIGTVESAVLLTENEYVVITNDTSGAERIVSGPQRVVRAVDERLSTAHSKVLVQHGEFIRVTDGTTGNRRIVEGPTLFAPDVRDSVHGPTSIVLSTSIQCFSRRTAG